MKSSHQFSVWTACIVAVGIAASGCASLPGRSSEAPLDAAAAVANPDQSCRPRVARSPGWPRIGRTPADTVSGGQRAAGVVLDTTLAVDGFPGALPVEGVELWIWPVETSQPAPARRAWPDSLRRPTDARGHFTLPSLRPGRYAVELRRIGYWSRMDEVQLPLPADSIARVGIEASQVDGMCSGIFRRS